MMIPLLVSLLIASHISSATALARDDRPSGEGRGFFMVGQAMPNLAPLNDMTNAKGYGTFGKPTIVGGIGFGVSPGGVLMGGEGYAQIFGQPTGLTNTTIRSSLGSGVGFFDIGMRCWQGENFTLFSYVGLGGGGVHYHMDDRASLSFQQALDNPAHSIELSRGFFAAQLAFLGEYNLANLSERHREGGFALGFKLAWLFDLSGSNWSQSDLDVLNGPSLTMSGLSLSLVLGGGGGNRSPHGETRETLSLIERFDQ